MWNILFIILVIILVFYFSNSTEYFSIKKISRKCFTPKIDAIEKKIFLDLITTIDIILKKYNIDWIPIGGNLLAVYRYQTLILPWDDDFDFVVEKKKNILAIEVLKNELPNYGCKMVFAKKWKSNGCFLYKIFFEKKKKYTTKNSNFNWPFLDFFVNNKINDNTQLTNPLVFRKTNMPNDIEKQEYPLKQIKCDGINIKVPTRGFRSYDAMKKANILDICFDDSLYHDTIKRTQCIGKNLQDCEKLPYKLKNNL